MTREEREDAIDIIQSILNKYEEDECLVTDITIGDEDIKAFKMAIKALEQEPKTGHWISFGVQGEVDGQIVRVFTCSECGAISIFRMASGNIVNGDLCPNCGAKMVEPQEGEETK